MTRKFKALWLILAAALIAGAIGATGVLAEEEEGAGKPKRFRTKNNAPTKITGHQAEITTAITTELGEIVCNETHFEGTMEKEEEKELAITPTFKECKAFGLTAHLKPNGCKFLFTLEKGRTDTGGGQGTHTQGPVHITCSGGKTMTIEVTFSGSVVCTVTIAEQTPEEPTVDTKNIGGEVLFTSTVAGINYSTSGTLCGSGEHIDGELDSVMQVAAYEDKANGEQVDFQIYGTEAP